MRKCKHPRPWGYRRYVIVAGEIKQMLFCKCDCGTWLPLGPSDETDPRVAVEIKAAERALKHDKSAPAYHWNYIDETHCNCWLEGDGPCCRCAYDEDEETLCEVGFLARCIIETGVDDE